MIKRKSLYYSEFYKHQQIEIDYLQKLKYIKIDDEGIIRWANKERVIVLNGLYHNEVISFYRMPAFIRNEIDNMVKEGLIYFESSLFSKPEADYFNYYMNNSKFQNGPRLRNRYVHGTLGSS